MSPYDSTTWPCWLLSSPGVAAIVVPGSPLECVSCVFKYMGGKRLGFSLERQVVLMAFEIWCLICRTSLLQRSLDALLAHSQTG